MWIRSRFNQVKECRILLLKLLSKDKTMRSIAIEYPKSK
jgi:hypothetical protein